jgi:hypothetical protein
LPFIYSFTKGDFSPLRERKGQFRHDYLKMATVQSVGHAASLLSCALNQDNETRLQLILLDHYPSYNN